jgi:hypothetical protein
MMHPIRHTKTGAYANAEDAVGLGVKCNLRNTKRKLEGEAVHGRKGGAKKCHTAPMSSASSSMACPLQQHSRRRSGLVVLLLHCQCTSSCLVMLLPKTCMPTPFREFVYFIAAMGKSNRWSTHPVIGNHTVCVLPQLVSCCLTCSFYVNLSL